MFVALSDDGAFMPSREKRGFALLERLGLYRVLPLHRLPISLSMKILFVMVLIVAAGFVVTLRLSLELIYDNIWRETQDKLVKDLKISRMLYDGSQKEVEAVVDFTAHRFFLPEAVAAGDFDRLQSQLEMVRKDRGLDMLVLTDLSGAVILRTTPPYQTGDYVASDSLVRKALRGERFSGTAVLSRERLEREGDGLVMRSRVAVKPTPRSLPSPYTVLDSALVQMSAYPVLDKNGNQVAALYGGRIVNNNFELADSIISRVFPEARGDDINLAMVSIFYEEVRVATTVRLDNGNRAVGSLMFDEISETVLQNGRNWLGTSWVVRDWYFAAYEPLLAPDGQVVGALGIGLWKGPFIQARDAFIWRFVRISFLGLGIAVLLGLLFSRMLTKPIRGLAEASGELAKGNLNYRVRIKPGRDEIRDLELSFNAMAQNLHASMEEKDRLAAEMQDLNHRYMELLGFASHELKQPIGVISATVSTLRKTGAFVQPDKLGSMLDRLDRNLAYISSMSQKYLHYSKIESGELTVYRRECRLLSEVIEPALEGEQKPLLEKKIRMDILNQNELRDLTLYVDPEMMRVVFSNLIGNAVKYGYQGGYLQLGFQETEDSYLFNVKNNGEGIPPDKLEEIFEKFRRLESAAHQQKGTGLGLFNVRTIVEIHGGRIWASSEPGKWADFTFSLPKRKVNPAVEQKRPPAYQDELWGY